MPNPNVTIVQQTEYQKYGPGSNVEPYIRVAFKVGVNGPFTVELAKKDFTAAAAWALIDPIADQVLELHPKP